MEECVAIQEVYCRLEIVLHGLHCIAIGSSVLQETWLGRLELYRNTLRCIATVEQRQGWTVLRYSAKPSHDTTKRRAAGARGMREARAYKPWASRRGSKRGASGRGARQGRVGRVARALGALPGRAYGHGLGQVGALYT